MMRARAKRLPGQPGTKALLKVYGDRLVCVRYRYDREAKRRYKTAEIIVDEAPWEPPPLAPAPDERVYLRVLRTERDIQEQIKAAGGQWRARFGLWSLRYDRVAQLGLAARIVDPPAPDD